MGVLDDKYLKGSNGRLMSREAYDVYKSNQGKRQAAMAILAAGVGDITSRDQIINPFDLIDPNMYENTRRGRALYESDLAALMELQKQQNAAYEEWYNSPEQAAARERDAGLNPDLIGLDNSGEAGSAETAQAVPGQNLPTNGQIAFNAASVLTSIVQSGVSLASLPTQFANLFQIKEVTKGLKLDNEAKDIANTVALGASISSDIEGLLSTAVQDHNSSGSSVPFDYDAWFANDDNFSSIRAMYSDNPRLDTVLSSQRSQILKHRKNMVALQKDWASDQFDFGQIASDPMFSDDQKLMLSTNIPLMSFFFDVRKAALKRQKVYDEIDAEIKQGLDVQTAIDAANQSNEYLAAIDGRQKAADEAYIRECQVASFKRERQIQDNLFQTWNSAPASLSGQGAMYLTGSLYSKDWYDFMVAYAAAYQLPEAHARSAETPMEEHPFIQSQLAPTVPPSFIPGSDDYNTKYPWMSGVKFGD